MFPQNKRAPVVSVAALASEQHRPYEGVVVAGCGGVWRGVAAPRTLASKRETTVRPNRKSGGLSNVTYRNTPTASGLSCTYAPRVRRKSMCLGLVWRPWSGRCYTNHCFSALSLMASNTSHCHSIKHQCSPMHTDRSTHYHATQRRSNTETQTPRLDDSSTPQKPGLYSIIDKYRSTATSPFPSSPNHPAP